MQQQQPFSDNSLNAEFLDWHRCVQSQRPQTVQQRQQQQQLTVVHFILSVHPSLFIHLSLESSAFVVGQQVGEQSSSERLAPQLRVLHNYLLVVT